MPNCKICTLYSGSRGNSAFISAGGANILIDAGKSAKALCSALREIGVDICSIDDCERALKVLLESNDSDAAKEGTELIYSKLMGYLKSKGLAVIEAMGQDFDTDVHEAVAQFPVQDEEQKGKVFDVVQTGYTLNGKVIRFAKVVVGI